MSALTPGRVCIKTAGRDAGEKCIVVKVLEGGFVEVKSEARKKPRRVSIRHLEPTDVVVTG